VNLPTFENAHVLVIGDAMLDRYWHGDADRVSAEAPIPVVNVTEVEDRPGGAANVALNVAALGARATLIAAVGDDEPGRVLASKLATAGIHASLIVDDGVTTTTKLRVVSQKQQLVRADFENNGPVDPGKVLAAVEAAVAEAAPSIDLVILSDYDKGVLDEPGPLIEFCRAQGLPVLVDPKFKAFSAYAGASIIKPNASELANATGDWRSEADMVASCHQLIEAHGLVGMLVTRGSQGMTLVQGNQEEVHLPAHALDVFDVTGAGDTVIATLGACLASGQSLLEGVRHANTAAGIVVGHSGTSSISGPELRLAIAAEVGVDRGVMSRDQLVIAVEEAKSCGERVVFTNGCFDILHAGHVDYLTEARQLGDRLIVAVNDDGSVHRLKGEGRPINALDRRATILAGLAAVDWVVAFEEDTPENLLHALHPDLLVKGGDYGVDQVVGAEIVTAAGGEVRVLKLVEGASTSALVEKIRRL